RHSPSVCRYLPDHRVRTRNAAMQLRLGVTKRGTDTCTLEWRWFSWRERRNSPVQSSSIFSTAVVLFPLSPAPAWPRTDHGVRIVCCIIFVILHSVGASPSNSPDR
ncbi:unnamed protein product, partial [Ectocarpus sp. 12 AP-2014]